MSYPADTPFALQYLGYADDIDFELKSVGTSQVAIAWYHADPRPTEQQVTDALASQAYADWLAEHGGDATLTERRIASEELDLSANKLVRALALTIMDELNTLRAEHALAPRTATQLRNAIKAKISDGSADS